MSFLEGYEFDTFSRTALYQQVTSHLIDLCELAPGSTVADIGCGSGLATASLLERFGDRVAGIVGIDPSEFELSIARRRVVHSKVRFLLGRAQDLEAFVGLVDATVLSNVLHQIPASEREPVLRGCHDVLRPGGRCAFNTLFYEGAVAPGTRDFYTRWMAETNAWLRERSQQLVKPQATPIALQLLTPGQHGEIFARAGMAPLRQKSMALTQFLAQGIEREREINARVAALRPGVRTAIEAAFQTWSDAGCATISFERGPDVATPDPYHWMTDPAGSRYILVYFSDDMAIWDTPRVGFFQFAHDGMGHLIGASIVLNTLHHQWSTTGEPTKMDVQSVATALVGRSLGRGELVVLGLAGALLHTWNHGLFKGLLVGGAIVDLTMPVKDGGGCRQIGRSLSPATSATSSGTRRPSRRHVSATCRAVKSLKATSTPTGACHAAIQPASVCWNRSQVRWLRDGADLPATDTGPVGPGHARPRREAWIRSGSP